MEIGGVKIEFLGHSGFAFTQGDKRIVVDPYNVSEKVGMADMILISHSHYDHCSIKDIDKVKKPGTMVVIPADAQSKITRVNDVDMQIIEVGEEITFGNIKVEAVPAYNVNKEFHPKAEGWMGFVIKFGGVVIYHAGDTDKISEMAKLTGYGKHGNHFVALLPVSGQYVMDADEAADVAAMISPDLVIPMHYGAGVAGTITDAQRFVEMCREVGLRAEILEKI